MSAPNITVHQTAIQHNPQISQEQRPSYSAKMAVATACAFSLGLSLIALGAKSLSAAIKNDDVINNGIFLTLSGITALCLGTGFAFGIKKSVPAQTDIELGPSHTNAPPQAAGSWRISAFRPS